MQRGFIKLWRKELDAGWIKNHKLWAFWSYCLLKATWKEYDAIIGYQIVHLIPGQFIFGHCKAAEETGLTISEIRTAIKFLKGTGDLTSESTSKYSIITVVNWNVYQSVVPKDDTQNDNPLTGEEQYTRRVEYKERKEYKKKTINNADKKISFSDDTAKIIPTRDKYPEGSDEVQLSRLFFNYIKERDTEAKVPDFQEWADHIHKLIYDDHRTVDEIHSVIDWLQEDKFLRIVISNTNKLRNEFPSLTQSKNTSMDDLNFTDKDYKKIPYEDDCVL